MDNIFGYVFTNSWIICFKRNLEDNNIADLIDLS